MFNISLVTQIMWSYIISLIFFDDSSKRVLYFVGFAVIIVGVVVFNLYDKQIMTNVQEPEIEEEKEETENKTDLLVEQRLH